MSYYVNRYILYKIILMTQKQKVLSFLKKKKKKRKKWIIRQSHKFNPMVWQFKARETKLSPDI